MTNNANNEKSYFPLGVQVSARAWQGYQLSPTTAATTSLYPLRVLSDRRLQQGRGGSAGELNLLTLLNMAFRIVIQRYLAARQCTLAMDHARLGERQIHMASLGLAMTEFVRLFPPAKVWQGVPAKEFLTGEIGEQHRLQTITELFVLATQAANPAAAPYRDLFDDTELESSGYRRTLTEFDESLSQEEAQGPLTGSLLQLLMAPILASPQSLSGQIGYLQRHWRGILPPELLQQMLSGFDLLQEEQRMRGGGPGPIPVPRFGKSDWAYEEPERFSADADWMSNVVMIAKTIYVWLDQLSRSYGRPIRRLDEIPEEELEKLSRWGFTALWLIGIWERSPASQTIKRIMGNPEAVSSAYSLYDYEVAHDLGGDAALANLKERCARRGIRLACDVVPNHTGLYSRWVKEHPDWYVQVDQPPYPAYRFSGHDLSSDGDLSLLIEDGYWNRTDAAVVFKHIDRRSGRERYIYHGNDGTHLPWNDTAQLNFLIPEVREAMIRTILHVARRFKVIRFDAAMTLAKKHFQRLWFPQPGGGAGVPSRAEHAMSREDFERVFPVEFWREVVDRVAAEVPDTLLLAEAFWLMEGYFVRTLGMHRVYNSAFMNMLKNEDNAKYRSVLKNILDFNPEILKRFVNFMNNPDEDTAVAQFGSGDKYFGVAVLLVTMPGLPMIGHGQVEGFREKYGMEYRKAYFDEEVNEGLVNHHQAQIFPLMRRRHLFSGSQNFVLYDFFAGEQVNEDVFAYSNQAAGERALIVYNNRYADSAGWVRTSTAKKISEEQMVQPTLGEALHLRGEDRIFYRFRDFASGLEYLRRGRDLCQQGLYLELGPYQYYAFLDFNEIYDEDGTWEGLCLQLEGRPSERLDEKWKKLRYSALLEALRRTIFPPLLRRLAPLMQKPAAAWKEDAAGAAFLRQSTVFFAAVRHEANLPVDADALSEALLQDLQQLRQLVALKGRRNSEKEALAALREVLPGEGAAQAPRGGQFYRILLPWLCLHRIAVLATKQPGESPAWLDDFLIIGTLREVLSSESEPPCNLPDHEAAGEALLVRILLAQAHPLCDLSKQGFMLLLEDADVQTYLGCNWFGGVQWFNRERLETLLYWLFHSRALCVASNTPRLGQQVLDILIAMHQDVRRWREQAAEAGYRMDHFRALVDPPSPMDR
jgi:glycosidase